MSMPAPTAHILHRHTHSAADAQCELTYEDRFLRRKRLTTAQGWSFIVDLAQTTSLDAGNQLELEDGRRVEIRAAAEPLLEIRGDLSRLAWHIGNRHTPCQISQDRLLIRQDHVLKDMLVKLGAELADVIAPFTPEGGAYGHGRTHGHDHGPAEGHAHDHSHAHHHDHGHDHSH